MAPGLVVKVNNFGFDFTFTVLNADNTPFDLSAAVVTLYVYTQEQFPKLLFSGNCVVTVPTSGICTYLVADTDFPEIGTYSAELEMTDVAPPSLPVNLLVDTDTFNINVIVRHPVP